MVSGVLPHTPVQVVSRVNSLGLRALNQESGIRIGRDQTLSFSRIKKALRRVQFGLDPKLCPDRRI
jgi:hypothetical protein